MLKLGLEMHQVSGQHLLNYSVKALDNEKKRVKTELKIYDQQFVGQFNRLPDKDEKQPMKPLYMYYKRLKQYIDKKNSMAAASQNISRGSSIDTQLSRDSRPQSEPEREVSNLLNPEDAGGQPKPGNKLEVQKKIHELKHERAKLRTSLDAFQKNFVETNNRKIKYTTDIGPVEHEFKRYKDLKNEIAKLEQALKAFA